MAAVHLFAHRIRPRLFRSEIVGDSVFAGMSVAYVFLVLLPEVDTTHEVLGEYAFLVVLAGFVAFYAVEHGAVQTGESERARLMVFWLRTVLLWVTAFLFVLTIPDRLHEQPTFFSLVVLGAALGLVVESDEVSTHRPDLHHRWGRWLLATAPLLAAVVDLAAPPPEEVLLDVLIAVLAGFVLLKAIVGRELEHAVTRFVPFLAGIAVYVALFFTQPLHP